MKTSFMNTLLAAGGSALLLSGCAGLGTMVKKYPEVKYSVVPNPLEVHGGKVAVAISGNFPPKYFHKKASVTFTPVLKYEGGETSLKPLTLIGESVQGGGQKIGNASGGSFSHVDTVPYKAAMNKCELYGKAVAAMGSKSAELGERKFADGLIITSTRVQNSEDLSFVTDHYVKEVILTQKGEIYYPIQQSAIPEREKSGKSARDLKDFAQKSTLKNIQIASWASPDGPIDLNDRLSNDRGKSSSAFLRSEMKKLKVAGGDDEKIYTLASRGEHWAGFQQLVGESELKDKQLILDIVGRHSDVNKREQEIKNLAVIYLELANKILPKLRKAEITISAAEPRKTVAQIDSLATAKPDSLDAEELLYAATLTDDANKRLSIFKAHSEVYPDDWRGYNNVAYIYLSQKNMDEAKAWLDKASAKKQTPEVLNNLGVLAAWNGDMEEAGIQYEEARKQGSDVNNNMGIISLKNGDYTKASEQLSGKCSNNAALVALLLNNLEGAAKKLECAEQDAFTYYLKAIVAARKGDVSSLTSNLKQAIEKEASYRREAISDLEFAKFKDSQEFKNALQ